jgi:hypothetical protein
MPSSDAEKQDGISIPCQAAWAVEGGSRRVGGCASVLHDVRLEQNATY